MQPGVLGKKIIEIHKEQDDAVMVEFIKKALVDFRRQALAELRALMPNVDGKVRLKILEAMIQDGGKDLIAFFLNAIVSEKNLLYAKSMLLVFGNFNHREALTELIKVERELAGDLKATYQRVCGKFKARFRQWFYATEFVSGNPKRARNAAQMMLKEPHPDYTPFLNQRLDDSDPATARLALETLAQLGDNSSLEAMFALLERTQRRRRALADFESLLTGWRRDGLTPNLLVRDLEPRLDTSEDRLFELIHQARRKEPQAFIDLTAKGFLMDASPAFSELSHFFRKAFLDVQLSEADYRKMAQALERYRDALRDLLEDTLTAMGDTAVRLEAPDLIPRIDELIPADEPNRERLMIAALMGFKTPESLKRLLDYVNQPKPPEFLDKALEALGRFQLDHVPENVLKLTVQDRSPELRRQAIDLVGRWGFADLIATKLLRQASPSLQGEGLRLIIEHRPKGGRDAAAAFLAAKPPASLLPEAIQALGAYPGDETGDALAELLSPDIAPAARAAATRALVESGGERRFERILAAIKGNPPSARPAMWDALLTALIDAPSETYAESFFASTPTWLALLNHENADLRRRLLDVLDGLHWEQADGEAWIEGFKQAMRNFDLKRDLAEEDKLAGLIALLRRQQENEAKKGRSSKLLWETAEQLAQPDHYAKMQALRRLATLYKPETAAREPELAARLVDLTADFLEANQGADDLLLLAVGVAEKLSHPRLTALVKPLASHANKALAQAARRAAGESAATVRSIFIMDDSKLMTVQLTNTLKDAGYAAEAATRTAEGLAMLKARPFDLLILDLNMPEMDGISFLRAARDAGAAPKRVLAIASSRDREELQSAVAEGVDGLLLKPFPTSEMLEKIKAL